MAIVKYCYAAKQWEQLNEHIVTLSKRRSQLKQAITKMVQEAYELVEKTPDLDTKLKLIETLRTVTTGKVRRKFLLWNWIELFHWKIYVENERARLTKKLADIYEGQGKTKDAAEILQELQVKEWKELCCSLFFVIGGNLRHDGSSRKTGISPRTNAFMFS